MKKLDNEWLEWININLEISRDKNEMFEILIKNDFQYDEVVKHLKILETEKQPYNCECCSTSCDCCSVNHILKNHTSTEKISTDKVYIYKVVNFLTEYECDELLHNLNNEDFKRSTTTNDDYEKDKKFRTSSTCYLKQSNKVYNNLDNKICEFIGIEKERSEMCQAQKYIVGQEFKLHADYFHEDEFNKKFLLNGGQRTWTFTIYLNDVEEGGTTYFPFINLDIIPKKGTAVIWCNLDRNQKGNEYSYHSGNPIIKGEKYIITKWFRREKRK